MVRASENTYSLTDKLYIGTFSDLERFKRDMVSEIYKRSGGNLDGVEILVRGDRASWINGFRLEHIPKSRYILAHHHLCEKVKERFMDGFYKSMDWAHRSKRHDYKIINTIADLYGEGAGLEAAFHIACDMNLVTKEDLKIWQGIILQDKPPGRKKPQTRVKKSPSK